MALKRWHRAGLLAAVMSLAAILILPPRPLPERDERFGSLFRTDNWYGYDQTRYQYSLSAALGRLRARRMAALMSDSLLSLTSGPRAVRSADSAITVVYEAPLTADSARVWLAMLERELAVAPRGTSRGVPLVVALASRPPGVHAQGRTVHASDRWYPEHPEHTWTTMRFVSPGVEPRACFAVLRLAPLPGRIPQQGEFIKRDRGSPIARTAVLDWCLMYARFGSPGPLVSRWASQRVEVRQWWAPGDNLALALERARRASREVKSDYSDEALRAYWSDPLYGGCARNGGVMCLKSVGLVPDLTLAYESRNGRGSLIAALMVRDPVRFERFWRSSESPIVALEQAYGQPVGDLIAEWRRAVPGMSATGPHTPPIALVTSVGWAVLAVGLSLLTAYRRQVSS